MAKITLYAAVLKNSSIENLKSSLKFETSIQQYQLSGEDKYFLSVEVDIPDDIIRKPTPIGDTSAVRIVKDEVPNWPNTTAKVKEVRGAGHPVLHDELE